MPRTWISYTGIGLLTLLLMLGNPTPRTADTPTPTLIAAGAARDFNGVTMVYVPAGCFIMGNVIGTPDEKPPHEICLLQGFWIDQFEVSNGQFEQFGGEASASSVQVGRDLPRENISWFEARDFCTLRDARLPTEAE